eukprot:3382608-Pleurochrysis_carterae.AAC.2
MGAVVSRALPTKNVALIEMGTQRMQVKPAMQHNTGNERCVLQHLLDEAQVAASGPTLVDTTAIPFAHSSCHCAKPAPAPVPAVPIPPLFLALPVAVDEAVAVAVHVAVAVAVHVAMAVHVAVVMAVAVRLPVLSRRKTLL